MERFELEIEDVRKLDCTWRDVFVITFTNKLDSFNPCDSLGLIAENSIKNIKTFCTQFDLEYSEEICDKLKELDLNMFPRKAFLQSIEHLVKKKDMLEKILKTDFYLQCVNTFGFTDIKQLLDIEKLDIELFIKYADKIKPRQYTLINKVQEKAQILVGIIKKNNKLGHISDLLVTNELKNVKLFGYVKTNKNLQKLQHTDIKLNCFCTGIGLATFLSFYNNTNNKIRLIFGFRNECDNLLKYFEVQPDEVILCESSKNKRVTNEITTIKGIKNENVFVCGNFNMQKEIFELFINQNKEIIDNKQFYYDSWE